jgi:hypothetical protein
MCRAGGLAGRVQLLLPLAHPLPLAEAWAFYHPQSAMWLLLRFATKRQMEPQRVYSMRSFLPTHRSFLSRLGTDKQSCQHIFHPTSRLCERGLAVCHDEQTEW